MGVIEDLFAQKPSTPIYHYTSNDGFLGIIQTKTIWASKLHYLNDSTEFAYALGMVKRELNELRRKETGAWHEFYDKALKRMHTIAHVHIFVACFSEVGDLLSQWRGYCPNSAGYSIAFDDVQLEQSATRQGFRLVRCVYDEAAQRAIVNELITVAGKLMPDKSPDDAATDLVIRIPKVAPALKHPRFAEEREWRLVTRGPTNITDPQVHFRQRNWTLIPYYALRLCEPSEPLKLSHVFVGPNPHIELAANAAECALRNAGVKFPLDRYGNSPFDIRHSSVPYRGW